MKFSTSLLPLLPLTAATFLDLLPRNSETHLDCYNNESYDPTAASPLHLRAASALASLSKRATVEIDAYAHILVAEKPGGGVKATVEAKFDWLNKNFAPWGYKFNLKDHDVTVNADWAKDIDTGREAKQAALRRGNYQTLNVYMVDGAKGGVCSLPRRADVQLTKDMLTADGCFVPWGPTTNTSTLTHEVGHWMGLNHVFAENGCTVDADGCDDTDPQEVASQAKEGACKAETTCGGKGKENIFNFMDYSKCSKEFTKCQGKRMDAAWLGQRKGRKVEA